MGSPSPVPCPTFRVVKNGSKIRFSTSGAIRVLARMVADRTMDPGSQRGEARGHHELLLERTLPGDVLRHEEPSVTSPDPSRTGGRTVSMTWPRRSSWMRRGSPRPSSGRPVPV